MSDEPQEQNELNEDGPGVNGDLASWLYVLGGIPAMILFFVVLFGLTGYLDGLNVMLPA
ncbi:MAG TPA: hypothetical protein VKA74_19375 [Myxococcota bacterium]|nr:hypothetical protein [Myxococcota bacterium]